MRGASVVGIEGRETWLHDARALQRARSLANLEFVHDDVRRLSRERNGEFDVVLCLGILYHLDVPDAFELIARVADVCRGFAIVETHVAPKPEVGHDWRGRRYWGRISREHAAGTSPEDKLRDLRASLDNETAFWLTRASLCNLLRHVGFTSVSECHTPVANLFVGDDRHVSLWGSRVTLAAIKGEPVRLTMCPEATVDREIDCPEAPDQCLFERELGISF